jgi:hypothetical protein
MIGRYVELLERLGVATQASTSGTRA